MRNQIKLKVADKKDPFPDIFPKIHSSVKFEFNETKCFSVVN
jgi:hypothetical protein